MLTKGQRVQTPLGVGTILGFEYFVENGMKAVLSDTDRGEDSRVLVQLDQPENWRGASQKRPHPYMVRSELSELKGQP